MYELCRDRRRLHNKDRRRQTEAKIQCLSLSCIGRGVSYEQRKKIKKTLFAVHNGEFNQWLSFSGRQIAQQGANSREPGGERRKERGERKEARDARDTTETRGKGREARDARHERRETQETQGEGPKARDARRETRRHERPKRSRGAKKTPKK